MPTPIGNQSAPVDLGRVTSRIRNTSPLGVCAQSQGAKVLLPRKGTVRKANCRLGWERAIGMPFTWYSPRPTLPSETSEKSNSLARADYQTQAPIAQISSPARDQDRLEVKELLLLHRPLSSLSMVELSPSLTPKGTLARTLENPRSPVYHL